MREMRSSCDIDWEKRRIIYWCTMASLTVCLQSIVVVYQWPTLDDGTLRGGGEDRPVKSNRELVRSTPANEKEIEKVQCVVCPESDVF